MNIERTKMKRQRTMRPLAALAVAAGTAVLATVGPLAATATAAPAADTKKAPAADTKKGNEGGPREQIGYICDYVEEYGDPVGSVTGFDDCEPINGAPFSGEIHGPFYIAGEEYDDFDGEDLLFRCKGGLANVEDEVFGYRCTEVATVI
jgi:hypothetical protein